MSLIKGNPVTKGASGMLGDMVVFRTSRGQLQMINKPGKRASLSDKQKVTVSRFQDAIKYAKKVKTLPDVMKEYETGINPKKNSAYHVALVDYLNAPTVDYVKAQPYTGAAGDILTIKARDDFKVVRVTVEIINRIGKVLERGDAERFIRKPFIWKYKVSVANPDIKGTVIRVTAFDRPGNKGVGELML
jgi:hypothetical protein